MKLTPLELEIKAINAMSEVFGNKYTLQPENFIIHDLGYLTSFNLSNGEEYLVKVYEDNSKPKIFKHIS